MTKPRLAIISSTDYKTYPMGGMMSFIVDLLPHINKSFDITLLGVNADHTSDKNGDIELNGHKYPFKIFSGVKTCKRKIPNIVRVVYNIWINKDEILQDGYDILYFHGIPLSFPMLLRRTTKKQSPKIVNHVHGLTNPFAVTGTRSSWNSLLANLYEKFRRWVVKKSDLILLASDQDGHIFFTSCFPPTISKHIKYVPNFADPNLFRNRNKQEIRQRLGLAPDINIFISAGRLSSQKDPILLIEAFALHKATGGKDSHLYIIGNGELKQHLLDLIKDKDLEDNVHCLGRLERTEITQWLSASDVYVYTSHGNGFPIALVEAGMCALPVVTTDVTGVHDIVIHGKTGYLANNRAPMTIALHMSMALEQHRVLAKNILLQSKQFTPDIIAQDISSMLESTLDQAQ